MKFLKKIGRGLGKLPEFLIELLFAIFESLGYIIVAILEMLGGW
jgi:hypothetical protein